MTFVDTGAWFALFVPWDRHHFAAHAWFANNEQLLFTTDFIIDETMTLFRQRGEGRRAIALGKLFFGGGVCRIHRLSDEEFLRAWEVFESFADKEWSFTDCTSKVVMERLGVTSAFSFDQHFRQFGTVTVVPSGS